ncbi:MAG: phosphonate ABC transporter ATP-binding protein [Bacilli bacterium]|jgi:phosphonate transport system ATP-binding protein|nr:phosphonate ABC transporter ATP-binding protein [Bacilli bacterium]
MIVFDHVSKVYPNGTKGLDDISLSIKDGEFVCIIGLSGAGKSTLLRSINRMHDITSGTLLVDDRNVSQLEGKELRELRRSIGMIFQSFNLVNRISVFKNVMNGRVGYHNFFQVLFGVYTKEEKLMALKNLELMGILDKAYERADKLSGGQQQRVALARALTQEPKIILADEPTASLDPLTSLQVLDDFAKINKTMGITIVANMHHVDLTKKYASRIIGIKAGKIVFDGTPDQLDDNALLTIYGRQLKKDETLGGQAQ